MLPPSTVRSCPAFFTCLFLLQLSVCCAGPARSFSTIEDKLRTLANIRQTTRNDPYVSQDYYRPDANELNQIPVTDEPFIPTTETFLVTEENDTESNGIHDPINPWSSLDLTNASGPHSSHSITTESSSFTDFQEVIHPISNDGDPVPKNPLESSYLSPLSTAPSHPLDVPQTYPSVNATAFPSATYIGIGSLPLMSVVTIPFMTTESPENAVVPVDLPKQVNNDEVGPLDWIQNETTVPPSYTSPQFTVDHPTDNSGTLTSIPIIPTKTVSSSGRPFGSSPQPRELGFPPVSNTHENFGIQVNWAEFR